MRSITVLYIYPFLSCSHENGGGFYRVSSYFISKIVTDIIPLRLIPVVLFSVVSYFMIGESHALSRVVHLTYSSYR